MAMHLRAWLCLCSMGLIGLIPAVSAADEVVVQASTARSRITIAGDILEYNGRVLVIQPSAGTGQQHYRASEVVSVKTTYTSAHMSGARLLKAGRHQLAQPELEKAIGQEPRSWVRREILALLIRCALRANDFATAGARFEMLFESDEDTPHISVIPVFWQNRRVSGLDRTKAIQWLSSREAVMQLIGASLLMFDLEHAEQARERIAELRRSPTPRVREIAWWQSQRLSIHANEVTDFDIERWEERVEDIPAAMRSGPWFLLGQGHFLRQDFDLAAAAYLQLPLVYRTDHPVTSQAGLSAANSLMKIGQASEAARLYEEVVEKFAWTSASAAAKESLTELRSDSGTE